MGSPFPLDGLVAYWSLDELSGTRVDRLGRAHLTEHNGVGFAPGRIRGAAYFDQVNSAYLSATAVDPIQTGNSSFTLGVWINPASISQCVVIGKDANNGRDYALGLSAAGRPFFSAFRSNKEAVIESSGPALLAGEWTYLMAGHSAIAQDIYLQVNNGPVDSIATDGIGINETAAEFRIGSRARSPISEFFHGAIDEVGIWKQLLSAPDRSALWNSGAGLEFPPPVPLLEALRNRLLTLPAVTEKVGARIYTLKFPQSLDAPALRLQEIDRVSAMHLRGVVEILRARVQIDAVEAEHHGDPYAGAQELAQAVRGSLETGAPSGLAGFRGLQSGIKIAAILADVQRERYDAESHLVRIEQDFVIWFHV